jgi:hypothetical protein
MLASGRMAITTDEPAELRRLRRENKILREELEVLAHHTG